MSEKILVTGANGFVGSALIKELLSSQHEQVIALVRRKDVDFPPEVSVSIFGDKPDVVDVCLDGVKSVVHCAARVHVMNDVSENSMADFRNVNVKFTLDLARKAAEAGVKRFIFLSSVKVNGEETAPGCPFQADDIPSPLDPYGYSKMEAEQGLRKVSADYGIEVVIIRPVLVYGPGVKANFYSMMSWLDKGFPLPLGAIRNKRSLVSLGNLVSLIVTCLDHPAAANQTFMVSDGEDVSTTELLTRMAIALDRPARLIPLPPFFLSIGAFLLGRRDIARRLNGSLQVDIQKTQKLLGWRPVESLDEGLARTAQSFKLRST
ncbi:SDR family oxidoreductase [Pseudomonas corrugata]|uniref:SDR family oxidoreductase n=1 Tax=Pseudomonas corrugata TaxID=47879 RepID=A0A7Y5Z6U9_9PSED|nr:SDR family oxidoreductase [Pseudomonas corrugata]MDU9037522.1 SDR family oxidoreductase [Pseudomonas corrugata]NUT87879.1 SDR family oxidoreductase [Pseudomonas corrugata]